MAAPKKQTTSDPLSKVAEAAIGLIEAGLVDAHLAPLLTAAQTRLLSTGYMESRVREGAR